MADNADRVWATRDVSPAFDLCATTRYALEKAGSTNEGSLLELLTAVLMCPLTFEALLNQVGQHLWSADPEAWKTVERAEPMAKLASIEERAGIHLDRGRRPMQTVSRVLRLRNQIAHAKPEHFEAWVPRKAAEEVPLLAGVKGVSPDWELACTHEFARLAIDDLTEVAEALGNQVGLSNPLHIGGMTMVSTGGRCPPG